MTGILSFTFVNNLNYYKKGSNKMIKKYIKYFILGLILIPFIIPNFLNNVRYRFEKTFGEPITFFYGLGIGVRNYGYTGSDDFLYDENHPFDEYYQLDDIEEVSINLSNFVDGEVILNGRVINSADPLIVLFNDKVIYDNKMSGYVQSFWDDYYLEKHFRIKLENIMRNSMNEITITTGNAVKKFKIKFK